jgi:glycosyltransferase involved in cell wall biosynthesis
VKTASPLRIAQVAPLSESVPPKLYGGTERVVHYLTEELVSQGHDVTLFASGDSKTSARLIPACPRSLRLNKGCTDQLVHHVTMLDQVLERAADFDVIHFHIDYLHFLISRYCQLPSITTLHGRLDISDLKPLYRRFGDTPVVSISHAQRRPLPEANWVANIYHGLPPRCSGPNSGRGGYLAFLARISPEKRPDRAIEIARATGMKLKIAAKVDPVDRIYYESQIKPLLNHPDIEFIGEIGDNEKGEFLSNAHALLFPIDWPEPFGLAVIEAMQHGTPTIAFSCGAIPEIVKEGVTGFVVNSIPEAVRAVDRVASLDRAACRKVFQERFTSERMARDYLAIYEKIIQSTVTVRLSSSREFFRPLQGI